MPRRNQRTSRHDVVSPFVNSAALRMEIGPDGFEYQVRSIPSVRAIKTYRCPGCDHEIMSGVAHIVSWPAESGSGANDRRHWHSGCWAARATRTVTRRWS
ncbi:MAG: hypothetical protein ACRCSF_13075 [Mycobacteriaceae bacterium]